MNVIIDYQTFKSFFNFDNPDPHFYYGFSYYKPFDSLSISAIIDERFIKSKTAIYYYQITRIDKNCERGYGILDIETNDFHWENNTQSMKFNIFVYPNIDKTRITGQVVDIHVPYEFQSETKTIYDLVRELDALHPAYPVNTFNDPRPDNEEDDVTINTENFNLLSLFPRYLEQIKDELPETITTEELNVALVELYNTFKGTES